MGKDAQEYINFTTNELCKLGKIWHFSVPIKLYETAFAATNDCPKLLNEYIKTPGD